MAESTALVSGEVRRKELMTLLKSAESQIRMALPKHMTPERMMRVAVTAFSKTPALQKCSVLSIASCVVQASELGLELTGPLGQAYMVPYWNKNTGCDEAQFQVGYRGLMELAYRSGRVDSIQARIAYRNDRFQCAYGTKPKIDHVPAQSDEGEPAWVYAIAIMKGGGVDFEVMSVAQINKHRAKYSKQKQTQFNPWESAWEEMAKKTVIRRLCKRLPVSVEMSRAVMVDEYVEAGVQVDMPKIGGDGAEAMITAGNGVADDALTKLTEGEQPNGDAPSGNGSGKDDPGSEPAPPDLFTEIETECRGKGVHGDRFQAILATCGVKRYKHATIAQAERILAELQKVPTE